MNTQADTRLNLYLVGFMGTGKSAVGRSLADELSMRFIDVDYAIEQKEGRGIPDIFAREGEAYFRKLEWDFIANGHPSTGCIVSCGGGLVTIPGITEMLKQKGLVVVLCASAETIYERTKSSDNRPLLKVDNPLERIRELLVARERAYREVGIQIMTDHRKMKDVVAHVLRLYRERSQRNSSVS